MFVTGMFVQAGRTERVLRQRDCCGIVLCDARYCKSEILLARFSVHCSDGILMRGCVGLPNGSHGIKCDKRRVMKRLSRTCRRELFI